jgi:hypothetical protein
MKITSKTLMVNVEFPIEIGQLKTTAIAQLFITKDDKGENEADVEFIDMGEITYMGMKIEGYTNWKKFKDFHKEMGLNFDKLLNDEFNKVMTEENVEKLIKDIQF